MMVRSLSAIIFLVLSLAGCRTGQEEMARKFEKQKENNADKYTLVYQYAVYLSTAGDVETGYAISLINEMISYGYPTEARYCIENLKRNGITSNDLLALRGLCYQHEMQYDLAMADFNAALSEDPDNPKIRELIINLKASQGLDLTETEKLERAGQLMDINQLDESESLLRSLLKKEPVPHEACYLTGLVKLRKEQYDSAYHFMQQATELSNESSYSLYATGIKTVLEGENLIGSDPGSFRGYLQKSRGLAAMGFFDRAQETLDLGLENVPDHVNLILAKALVWVQEGNQEAAQQYLLEQERRGIRIDPALKQQVLKEAP
ncbi:MAG: tetratricopeptide repeat protein [Bacteroidota bacterium]